MQDIKQLRRGFLWNTGGNLCYMLCQFLFSILVIRLGGLTNAGFFNLAQGYANIFLTIASYGMYSFQVSDTNDKYSQYCYIKSRAVTIAAASGVCVCVVIAGSSALGYSALQCACIVLFHAYRMLESATDVFHAAAQRQMDLVLIGKTYALRGVVSLTAFAATLMITRHIGVTLLMMVLSNLVVLLLYTLPRARVYYQRVPVAWHSVRSLLTECFPLAVYSALSTTTASLPKILMEQVLGGSDLGIYSAATTPVLLLQVGATYLFTPFITLFSTAYADRSRKRFRRAVLGVQGVVLALLPIGWLIARFLGRWGLEVFVGAQMGVYQPLLEPMVLAAVLTSLVLFYSMILTIMRCMKGLITANLLGIFTAALVSVPCLRIWGMQGATVAAIIALTAQAATLGFMVLRRAQVHFSNGPHRQLQEPDGLPSDATEYRE